MKRLIALAPLALLVILVALAALVLMRGGEQHAVSGGDMGRPAPTFALASLEGGDLVTSDTFAGRPHLINFFASWCTPCRAEHAELMALKQQGVAILGIAYKDRPEASRQFLQELGDPFAAVALDPDGRYALEIGVAGAVPETFVIGADGRIRDVYRGPLTREVIEQEVLPALNAN